MKKENFNVEAWKLRYIEYILNLAMKFLLFNDNMSILSKELQEIIVNIQENDLKWIEMRKKEWWTHEIVERLYNIIIYIHKSI